MKKLKLKTLLLGLSAFVLLAGCSTQPKLYPNDYYQKVGQSQAQKDIEYCEDLAEQQPVSGGQTAWEVTKGSLAILSIVATGNRSYSGQSNAGSIADTNAILEAGPSSEDNEKQFIESCLKNKGYDVTGWEY
ncbi:hypothetical protein OAO18_06135 [Francisellaceae bacterium]|nr:hypothetical protein [Francisellaceae bacterium]